MREHVEQVISAGGVVYRHGRHGIEVVLCGRRAEELWALPKGTPAPGEPLERTALREVEEETGLRVAIEAWVGEIRYQFTDAEGRRFDKRVTHHLMRPTGGDLARHDGEYDEVRWFPLEEALRLIRYPNERDIVQRAVRLIQQRERV